MRMRFYMVGEKRLLKTVFEFHSIEVVLSSALKRWIEKMAVNEIYL